MFFHVSLLALFVVVPLFSFFGAVNPNVLALLGSGVVFLFGIFGAYVALGFGRLFFRYYIVSVVIFTYFLTVGNWWYFQYFQSYFTFQVIGLGGDAVQSLSAVSGFKYKQESAALLIAVLVFMIFVFATLSKNKSNKLYVVPMLLSLFFGVAGSVLVNLSLKEYQNLNVSVLHPNYVNPVYGFFLSKNISKDISSVELAASAYFYLENNDVVNKSQAFTDSKYNVIFITLESVRASFLGGYGDRGGLSPNFDELAKSLVFIRDFYANSNYTIKGEVASWCGIFDQNAKPPISKSTGAIKSLQCLPKILAERGYETAYFHGNTASFNSRKEFLPVVGFDHQYFPEDNANSNSLPRIGWGISDEYMYQFMLDILLSKGDKPFFAHFMTVSSHYPYGWDWGIAVPFAEHANPENASEVFENYKNAVFYEDYALGKFWAAFEESPLYENTIVVITADHGVWVFDEEETKSLIQKSEEFFRVPLLIYHPDIDRPMTLTGPGSQIDLPETVLNMLGIKDYDDFFIGKNLFDAVENPWAIMMKQGDIVVRKNDTICYVEGAGCAGVQQDCVAIAYGELMPDINKLQRCQKITGDLLKDGGAVLSPQPADPELMDKAFSLIRYHNKKVFMD